MRQYLVAAIVGTILMPVSGYAETPSLKWVFEAQSNLYAPPLIADVHPAPGLETILSDSEAKRLLCVDAQGALLWEYKGDWKKRLISAAALRPANANEPALLAVANADGILRCVDAQSGASRWQFPIGTVEWGGALWTDLDGDGAQEIVAGTEHDGVIALDATGHVRWRYPERTAAEAPNVRAPMAAADIDGDHRAELFGCAAWGVFCLNPDGALRWQTAPGDDFTGSPSVADADRDGRAEVYCSARNDNATWCFDAETGAIRWQAPMAGGPDIYPGSAIAIGDIDQDGRAEIISGTAKGQLYVFTPEGAIRWIYTIEKPAHLAASLGDVDGDGRIEVLAVSGDHYVYCLDERGELKWKFATDLRLIYPPAIADVDGDGKTDLLVCGSDHRLRCLSLNGRYRPDLVPWPSRRYDAAQSGSSFDNGWIIPDGVAITRPLFLCGDFEQNKTVDTLNPSSEPNPALEQRKQAPRGWFAAPTADLATLSDSAAFSGNHSLRLAPGGTATTAPIALDLGLRNVSVTVRAQGTAIIPPEIEWMGRQGAMGRTPLTLTAQEAWQTFQADNLAPPNGALWIRLTLSAPPSAYAWFDGVDITGTFTESRAAHPLVNQVGYDLGAPKKFTVQSNWPAQQAAFLVLRDDGTEAFHGALTHEGRITGHFGHDWGNEYWRGDFTALDTPGQYRIRTMLDGVESDSWPFEIGPDVLWSKTSRPAYRFFYYQRCGMEIPGYHKACHLDDAVSPDGKTQHELWGGWHDAGDYNKYHNAPYVYGLARAYGLQIQAFAPQDEDHNGLSDLLDEILWGGEHVRRMLAPDGSAYGGITSGYGFWGPPELETDNIPGTGDERPLSHQESGADPSQHHAALARIAAFVKDPAPWIEPAARGLDWALQHGARSPAQCGTAIDLYTVTKDPKYAALAKELLPAAAPAAEIVDIIRRYDAAFGEDHHDALRAALTARAAEMLRLAGNPFGVYTFGPADHPNFFGGAADNSGWHVGTSTYLLEAANLMALAYQYEPDPRYLDFVYDQFNWELGVNPFDISLMEGQGSAFLPSYHQRLTFAGVPRGAIPGSVVNGVTWRAPGDDRPYVDMSGVDIPAFEPNECWLPHNTAYVNAIANLHAAKTEKE